MGDAPYDNSAPFDMMRKSSFSRLTADDSLPRDLPTPGPQPAHREKLYKLMESYLASDTHSIQRSIVNHVEYTLACTRFNFDDDSAYRATAFSIRDRLIEACNDTYSYFNEQDVKRCLYLSLEFLIGRAMQNALVNLDIESNYRTALEELGFSLENLYSREHDAALGNGGLGRLAACFLDSMATLNYPCWGYGIRYSYGIFEQQIKNGCQFERPDYWLVQENPWEIERPDVVYGVRFNGHVETYTDAATGHLRQKWVGGELVQAMAHDYPIPGFDTLNCITLRLWRAQPSKEFDFTAFNSGDYVNAVRERMQAEWISAVLYPNDNSEQGKTLRLKQQYFFVCATLQDALRRFKKEGKRTTAREWKDLPTKMVAQLNDTHPTIAIPEMMRLLVDVEGVTWEEAWQITRNTFCYTNHTVLPEALEKWPAGLIEHVLPRHLQIINEINFRFLNEVRVHYTQKDAKRIITGQQLDYLLSRMSVYEEGHEKRIRMANLAVIGCKKVNGVAAIHSEIVKKDLFPEFVAYYREAYPTEGEKFINVTNGVTPRRWLHNAARQLSLLISETLGSDEWLTNLDLLQGLIAHAKQPKFQQRFREVKRHHKQRLADFAFETTGHKVNVNALFDVQVKRIHEYKRQLLHLLFVVHRYLELKDCKTDEERKKKGFHPRAHFMGGKAAPGYARAKAIIRLANSIGETLRKDASVSDWLSFTFLPNYNVSSAEIIVPASDLSEHISTAGTEASGTSNMKFVMTGGRIIGTLDGANVEIHEEAGGDKHGCMFVFGLLEHEVERVRAQARQGDYPIDPRLQRVFSAIKGGMFADAFPGAQGDFDSLIDSLTHNGCGVNSDFYLVIADFPAYVAAQMAAEKEYADEKLWTYKCILQTATTGKFSTDRTIQEYAKNVWDLKQYDRAEYAAAQGPVRARSFAQLTSADDRVKNATSAKQAPAPVSASSTAASAAVKK